MNVNVKVVQYKLIVKKRILLQLSSGGWVGDGFMNFLIFLTLQPNRTNIPCGVGFFINYNFVHQWRRSIFDLRKLDVSRFDVKFFDLRR